jgi:hypothetical protein
MTDSFRCGRPRRAAAPNLNLVQRTEGCAEETAKSSELSTSGPQSLVSCARREAFFSRRCLDCVAVS